MTAHIPGGDDMEMPIFPHPAVPSKAQLAEAAVLFVHKYRAHYHYICTEQLTYDDVEKILDGVREFIYQYEELRRLPPK